MKEKPSFSIHCLVFALLIGVSTTAFATKKVKAAKSPSGAFVEPFLGYSLGTFNYAVATDPSLNSTVSLNGIDYGLRGGYVRGGYFIAPRMEFSSQNTQYGIDLGGTLASIPLRIYFGINIKDTLHKLYQANGFKFGVGYFVLNNLAVNLDYTYRTYAKGKTDLNQIYSTTYNNFLLSVSIPFTFWCPPMPVSAQQGESLMNMFSSGDND